MLGKGLDVVIESHYIQRILSGWCIEGKQYTIIWDVDALKLSHVRQSVLEDIAKRLNQKYGQKVPLTVHHGLIQEYLGMTINYSE
jgi:hypothetical protein